MGAGIAQVAARAGFAVVMHDVTEEFLARGMKAIDMSLQREVDKQRLEPDEKDAIIARIKTLYCGGGGDRRSCRQNRNFQITGRDRLGRCDLRFEYFFYFDHQTRVCNSAGGTSDWDAFHESRTRDEVG